MKRALVLVAVMIAWSGLSSGSTAKRRSEWRNAPSDGFVKSETVVPDQSEKDDPDKTGGYMGNPGCYRPDWMDGLVKWLHRGSWRTQGTAWRSGPRG